MTCTDFIYFEGKLFTMNENSLSILIIMCFIGMNHTFVLTAFAVYNGKKVQVKQYMQNKVRKEMM